MFVMCSPTTGCHPSVRGFDRDLGVLVERASRVHRNCLGRAALNCGRKIRPGQDRVANQSGTPGERQTKQGDPKT